MALYRILLGIRINKYLKEMEKIKEKAASLLQKCEVVVLSSMNAEGYPRPVPIVRIASEGLSTIWMSTGASSLKTTEFRANAKAGLCYYSDGDSVVLTGVIVNNPASGAFISHIFVPDDWTIIVPQHEKVLCSPYFVI